MAQMLETIASIVASVGTYLAPPAALIGLGLVPRVGPLRALYLGVSSKWGISRPAFTTSQRTLECNALLTAIGAQQPTHYLVVIGPKGVGKTTIIDTATAKLPGVVHLEVLPGASPEKIHSDVLKTITRFQFSFVDPAVSGATRVISWHTRFFRMPPTVILHVGECPATKEPAAIGSTVRQLVERHKLRVIVDSSDSSLDKLALNTGRQRVLQVGPMERDVLESIPEFQDLLEALKAAGEADLVWGVLGGHPHHYKRLKAEWVEAGYKNAVKVAESFITDELRTATDKFNSITDMYPWLIPVYDQFKTVDELPASAVKNLTTDKVLRYVAKKGQKDGVLVPSSPAMALVMRYSVGGFSPSLEVVRKSALGMN